MKNHTHLTVIALALFTPLLFGQTNAPVDIDATVAITTSAGQAPGDVMKKLSALVHDGKNAEAQQLTTGLLLAYPDDQRLIKGKTLLDKLLATAKPADIVTGNSQPTNSVAQPTTEQLTGMDKVEYNSLIELGKEAQQTTDLDQQKTLLHRFMDESKPFLEKHPNDMLLWQLRAASALSLGDVVAGYEAGQKLLASGLADNDPNMQRLLSQLNLKGWLNQAVTDNEKMRAENQKKFGWLLGTWDVSWSWKFVSKFSSNRGEETFILSGSAVQGYKYVEGYEIDSAGSRCAQPDLRGQILDSGEISWQCYLPSADPNGLYVFRYYGAHTAFGRPSDPGGYSDQSRPQQPFADYFAAGSFYPSGWQPVVSCKSEENARRITITIPLQSADPKSKKPLQNPVTLVFTKTGGTQNQQLQPQH